MRRDARLAVVPQDVVQEVRASLLDRVKSASKEALVSHPRAKLTVQGRQLLVERVLEEGWSVPMAAEAQGCSSATGYKWIRRFIAEGLEGLRDRSSRPHRSPERLSTERERAILLRREQTLEGPHRIAWALGEAPSTVHRVLRRLGAPLLRDLDRPTRLIVRYERERPGELIHVDTKKQGKIPSGGGWRVHGRAAMPGRHRGEGYDFIHAAVDDRSRLAYAEVLPDERKESASAFMTRAITFFADRGITVERVLTDNGSCYRSREFARTLTEAGIGHNRLSLGGVLDPWPLYLMPSGPDQVKNVIAITAASSAASPITVQSLGTVDVQTRGTTRDRRGIATRPTGR